MTCRHRVVLCTVVGLSCQNGGGGAATEAINEEYIKFMADLGTLPLVGW